LAETLSPAGDLISIPALLARNAKDVGRRTAYREKEFGIWQSWTWAEAEAEIRALALGFLALGLEKGDYVAIIGRNRPQLYWAMVAAQAAGAIPVPLYQDAVAEEMAYVLDHCGARFVVCGRSGAGGQGDRDPGPGEHIDQIVYVDKRGMRKYDHARLNWIDRRAGRGARGAPAVRGGA
jgi:long-chain acyl-CoA synthetase